MSTDQPADPLSSSNDAARAVPSTHQPDALGAEQSFTRTAPSGSGQSAGPVDFVARLQQFSGPAQEEIPAQIGPYRCLRTLGRGGMGTVILAVQEDQQFKRRVAIKLLRRGMDTADVLRRFELERQVLGALNHPNIARLLDAGQTTDGRPYCVMEYVEGRPIDEYCDAENLAVDERLKLFRKVCQAVHFAHQNLVVHRDLKPGNILVGGDGEPKLLDFGIAKLLNPDLLQVTVATGPEFRLMTPEYASPEQVQGLPIGTASDVYSLGVLLYELLSGHRPYRFATRMQQEIVRVVCEVEPEKPSAAVSRVEDVPRKDGTTSRLTPDTVARARGGQPHKLRRRLSGDLDNVVLKALQKVPRRRYASAEQFSADIQRHLDGLPIEARPDSQIYRFNKFVRRHRIGVTAAAGVFVALLAGVIGTGWQWRAAEQARSVAEHRTQQYGELVDALVRELRGSIHRLEGATAARKVLAATAMNAANTIESEGADDPAVRRKLAEIYLLAGDVLGGIRTGSEGSTRDALACFQRALSILTELQSTSAVDGTLTSDLARAHIRVADCLREDNTINGAREHYEAAVTLLRAARARDPRNDRSSKLLATALDGWADIALSFGRADEALAHFDEAEQLRAQLLQASPQDADLRRALSVSHGKLGKVLADSGKLAEALQRCETALAMRKQLAEWSPDARAKRDLVVAHERTAEVLRKLGRSGEAESHVVAAVSLATELRESDPRDMRALLDLVRVELGRGELQLTLGRRDAATATFEQALANADAAVAGGAASGEARYRLAQAHEGLARALGETDAETGLGHYRSAIGLYREVLQTGRENVQIAETLAVALADCAAMCDAAGDRAAAAGGYREALAAFEELTATVDLAPDSRQKLDHLRARLAELAPDAP